MSTGPLLLSPLSWVMETIAEAEFTGVELLVGHNPETRDPGTVTACAAQAGLAVPVVHGPYMMMLRSVFGPWWRTKTRRSLQFAAAIGAETMVAHAPFRWERRARAWLAAEANDEAADRGVALGMENLYPVRGRALSSVITLEELRAFPHVVFDTSHFAVSQIDLFTAWEALSDRVAHLHVSDNFGYGKDSHAPIGSGTLPLEQFLAHVGRSGYTGTLTLELDCRPYLDSRANLLAFLTQQRTLVSELLSGQRQPAAEPLSPPPRS